ncbi:hypothetical protein [Salibacterium halotolerans]|uniref:GTP cyclohydrolase III n=1 Tax=Salibacterium halotolerans TaxID=1884432 RepID=A0A1I5S7Z1_9BACI|nr:hypothetical protein [Salibacterium halotolerans]SFP66811.1 hypothetical protein SAMN05518683_10883 [Salibacterium halotolerans]
MSLHHHPSQESVSIGVIGPEAILEHVQAALSYFPSFTPYLKPCDNEEEAVEPAAALGSQVEILLFSDYYTYHQTNNKTDLDASAHFIPLSTGIYRSLSRVKNAYGLQNLSIDMISKEYVEESMYDLEHTTFTIYDFHGVSSTSPWDIAAFHKHLFDQGVTSAALTSIKSVAGYLTSWNIPSEWVIPTHQDIMIALERALLATETRRNKESQIVVGLIKADYLNAFTDYGPLEHEAQKLKLEIQRMLLDYVKQLDGHLIDVGEEYLFFTTRGVFERETRGYKFMPLLKDIQTAAGISLSIGIGFGRSATNAGTNARLALGQSQELGGNTCFIVREDKSVIGPVEMTHPIVYDLTIKNAELIEKARSAGMSAVYMNKLLAQVDRLGKTDYTAHELAGVLGITLRSVHRILVKWMDAGLIEIIGEEKAASKGRPRQIYRISILSQN